MKVKRVPASLSECRKVDEVAQKLWDWSENLKRWGQWLLIFIFVCGVVLAVVEGVKVGDETDRIEPALMAMFGVFVTWGFYAVIEYLIYQTLALLIGALASIVQHTRLQADLTLYNTAKAEGYVEPAMMGIPKATVDTNDDNVKLTDDNINDYIDFEWCCVNIRDDVSAEGATVRKADAYVKATPKTAGYFKGVKLQLIACFENGYKVYDEMYDEYTAPNAQHDLKLLASGNGQSDSVHIGLAVKDGKSLLPPDAHLELVSVKGTYQKTAPSAHKWRCTCGRMIAESPCPYCGAGE